MHQSLKGQVSKGKTNKEPSSNNQSLKGKLRKDQFPEAQLDKVQSNNVQSNNVQNKKQSNTVQSNKVQSDKGQSLKEKTGKGRLSNKQRKKLIRICTALVLFILIESLMFFRPYNQSHNIYLDFMLFLVPCIIAGYDIFVKAVCNIFRGKLLDENFLMSIASIGAFCLVIFPESGPHMAEGTAVMIFYQIGEWFQDYAAGKSRKSISSLMDIVPEYTHIKLNGSLQKVNPHDVSVGDVVVLMPGDRVPLDGVVLEGKSQIDTSALTGESLPRSIDVGEEILSGCVNLSSKIEIRVMREYGQSAVSRILELVESANEKKAQTEKFFRRFAHYYTPLVVGCALLLAFAPPLFFGGAWASWVERGLVFLVVSCPCALVISIPLSFFAGIGGASRKGVLIKGSTYLEMLAQVKTIAFDKTGTLTKGTFTVVDINTADGIDEDLVLSSAAYAEVYSKHPIAQSVCAKYNHTVDVSKIEQVKELSGMGVLSTVCFEGEKHHIAAGNSKLMKKIGVSCSDSCFVRTAQHNVDDTNDTVSHNNSPLPPFAGTVVHVARDGEYLGQILISDEVRDDSAQAIANCKAEGVLRTVLLTGDSERVAAAVSAQLSIDEYYAQMMPEDKVAKIEKFIAEAYAHDKKSKVCFVGDGINDAPVLARADVGIAMGGVGSDAAIEAADIVLVEDKPSQVATALRIARKTMSIVWQNVVFALGVKVLILLLAAIGVATLWPAVFADVGVCVLVVFNSTRAMKIR